MARVHTPAIPARMYRHFAVVTLALTAMLAFFADGENRQAADQKVAAKRQHDALRRESYARFGAPTVGGQPAPVGHFSMDADADGDFGKPMDSPSGGYVGSPAPSADPLTQLGYSQAYLNSLGKEERQKLLEGLRQSGMLDENERRRQSAALSAASARRSGAHPAAE